MQKLISKESLINDLHKLGIQRGDTVMLRASMSAIGKVRRDDFIEALLETVGSEGTIMSLAFTTSVFPWNIKKAVPFNTKTLSYAGALPNSLLLHPDAVRSAHPQTSFVAIGKHAKFLTDKHNQFSGAYEPVRQLIELGGKMVLIGCVESSPGFTTTHLVEGDLNLQRRLLPSWWFSLSKYVDEDGTIKIFKRKDGGFCSNSYYKFYANYVSNGVLHTGFIGNAYSILAPSVECYEIEKKILQSDPYFNVCDSPDCFTCNIKRIDRLHHAPYFLLRRLFRFLRK